MATICITIFFFWRSLWHKTTVWIIIIFIRFLFRISVHKQLCEHLFDSESSTSHHKKRRKTNFTSAKRMLYINIVRVSSLGNFHNGMSLFATALKMKVPIKRGSPVCGQWMKRCSNRESTFAVQKELRVQTEQHNHRKQQQDLKTDLDICSQITQLRIWEFLSAFNVNFQHGSFLLSHFEHLICRNTQTKCHGFLSTSTDLYCPHLSTWALNPWRSIWTSYKTTHTHKHTCTHAHTHTCMHAHTRTH